ncbi:uncharacterized protein EI97DRAFT_12612 [Westerdykella ornata]|uniref:Fungal N-terminal domain-containing protein n=1 Tax=Westerdykella ornata TaxID=318751 RepID=A0A6A6JXE9_WESOR|nr:uncharacterized protein EI97DRAFT_12612 [Westerdykella ornata]KAF2280895.1 hypothetical protein EI97DRAFT_12612 [Westerdykella ornata]
MADFAAIFSAIARSSSLALNLYKIATASPQTADIIRVAQSINSFSSALKQIATLIREDDTIYSSEAGETLEDVLDQAQAVLNEIEAIIVGKGASEDAEHSRKVEDGLSKVQSKRLLYLQAHLDALRATLAMLQQTLYTAQSIIWATVRPAVSPQQAAAAVGNEKTQLENAVIEQQISLLFASKVYQPSRPDARLLMETESTNSVMVRDSSLPSPGNLHRYQERFIASLDISETSEDEWLPAVCGIAKSHLERLLERWTRLRQFHERMEYEKRREELEKRETQQPTVESDSDEDGQRVRGIGKDGHFATPLPHRPGSTQPLFSESTNLPIPVKDPRYGPTAPLSPASSSPRDSANSVAPPLSPRTDASHADEETNLEIPWKLCTRRHYWRYVDSTVTDSNTDLPPSSAFSDRNAWTEILASWVCKQALEEAGLPYAQVQKERRVGRRTTFEPCFCVQAPLTFAQVQGLVERTVELYRRGRRGSQSSERAEEHRRGSLKEDRRNGRLSRSPTERDRDKTPLAVQHPSPQPPPLDRSSTYTYPPLHPRASLERAASLPGKSVPSGLPSLQIPHPTPLPGASPMASRGAYSQLPPSTPTVPGPQPPPQSPYLSPHHPPPYSPSYLQSRNSPAAKHAYIDASDTTTTSDSDTAYRSRERRKHRSRSHRGSSSAKKSSKVDKVASLATIGGLAAMLDGIVEMGVL